MRFSGNFSFHAKITGIFFLVLLLTRQNSDAQVPLSTQPEKTQTRAGNNEYKRENFAAAEASYKKALDRKNNMPEAMFNLGDAVYEQKRYEDAQKQFQLSAKTNTDPVIKAKAFHNLGNSYLSQKKWEDAIQAYKSALKINPADADTKYNLAYANAMLTKNNGGGGEDNKDQDQKDQQQNKDQQQQQNDQKKEQEQKQDQQQSGNEDQKNQQSQQAQQPRLSKQEAERLLAAMEHEEQKTTQKMQQKQMKAVKVKIKKDW